MDNRWSVYLKDKRFRDKSSSSPNDGRDPFENDYSRLISSAPIRRLQDKTQVFPLEKSDFVRTRLTHSLEVSSIARSLGKSIEAQLVEKNKLAPDLRGHISSLLSTAGLIHDLGNPPFGHFGEKAIQAYFTKFFEHNTHGLSPQEQSDFVNFDGNVQTLRILRKLYFLVDEHGYNLSYPTLHVIVKYPCSSVDGNLGKKTKDIRLKKFGFFSSETADFKSMTTELGLNYSRHPATFLLEAADDIAYSCADIEDGIKLGVLSYQTVLDILTTSLKGAHSKLLEDSKRYLSALKGKELDVDDVAVQRFRILIQRFLIESVIKEFMDSYEEIMDGKYQDELLARCEHCELKAALDEVLIRVLKHRRIINIELAGWNVITGLLEEYVPASLTKDFCPDSKSREGRLYRTISSSYRHLFENYKNYPNDTYRKLQLVTDFVSGMTDTYALDLYQRLRGIKTV
ncbi:MAG: dNTP triphosphohydrolase [Flavobacteriales bacterium]|nr:dNTP triphosphohydrolase [Flavobacteriales bacterium]